MLSTNPSELRLEGLVLLLLSMLVALCLSLSEEFEEMNKFRTWKLMFSMCVGGSSLWFHFAELYIGEWAN